MLSRIFICLNLLTVGLINFLLIHMANHATYYLKHAVVLNILVLSVSGISIKVVVQRAVGINTVYDRKHFL